MDKKVNKSDIILQAAKIVFASEGYHNSSVSRIAKEAGIGDGTVYLYFENKEDILRKLFHHTIYNHFVPLVKKQVEHIQDARICLYELIKTHFDFFENDYELAKVVQVESRQSNPSVKEAMKEGSHSYFRLIESIIIKGQNQRVFRQDISPRTIRKIIFGSLDEVVMSWVLSSASYSLKDRCEEVYKVLLQATYDLSQLSDVLWLTHIKDSNDKVSKKI